MCGIVEHTSDMATVLKEKLKEKEKQIQLAKVTKRIDKMIKAIKHLAEKEQVSPEIVKAIEHLTTEKEEMAGILECPAKQQRASNRLANNRFAALSEEEEVDHGGRPTMTDMCATNEVRDNQNMRAANRHGASNQYSSMANETMMNNEYDMSVRTT